VQPDSRHAHLYHIKRCCVGASAVGQMVSVVPSMQSRRYLYVGAMRLVLQLCTITVCCTNRKVLP
jgi:hypothetical protein